jgi:hypothetical protein
MDICASAGGCFATAVELRLEARKSPPKRAAVRVGLRFIEIPSTFDTSM